MVTRPDKISNLLENLSSDESKPIKQLQGSKTKQEPKLDDTKNDPFVDKDQEIQLKLRYKLEIRAQRKR